MKIIIIGAGIGGVQAATSLRDAFPDASILLAGREKSLPYYRPRLGEILLGGKEETILIHDKAWYESKRIDLRLGLSATSIDKIGQRVSFSDGSEMAYDYLVLAIGSDANTLPLERKNAYTFRTLEDAKMLHRLFLSHPDASVAVIGGGLLGLENAAQIAQLVKGKVQVLETAPYLLPRQINRAAAQVLEAYLSAKGIEIIVDAHVEKADDTHLYLEGGRVLESDIVIESVGVHTDCALAKGAGLETHRGIMVDASLRTEDAHIFAIGDATELSGRCFGQMQYAMEMGMFVAKALKDGASDYVPGGCSAALKVAGFDLVSMGTIGGEGATCLEKKGNSSYEALFVREGILEGVILAGSKAHFSLARKMLGKAYDPEAWK